MRETPRYYGPSPLHSCRERPRVGPRFWVGVGVALYLTAMLGLVGWVLWRLLQRAAQCAERNDPAWLLLPLALIWFPEEIGELTGYFRSGYVNVQTPAVMVSFLGWLFLGGLPVLLSILTRH